MDKITINGGIPLCGEIEISGAKNAALPLMAASILTHEELTLSNVPFLADITTMANLLATLGVSLNIRSNQADSSGRIISFKGDNIKKGVTAPYDIVRKMRASVVVLGPLLARFGAARVSLPGGCAIGARPIDFHLQALEKMGAIISIEDGYIAAHVEGKLQGAEIEFPIVSVGATENILMAATLADGTTIIKNAAKEPEVTDLANCLVAMGAKIEGIGTDTLIIKGVECLHSAEHKVLPDRIEAGTYAIAAAITGGEILLKNTDPESMGNTLEKLAQAGVEITVNGTEILAKAGAKIKATNAKTQVYPDFATDMQAQFMALMTLADGESKIEETIFENRFMHVPELVRMGANIHIDGNVATIKGVANLKPAEVMATDLRASVSLVLAALACKGKTVIRRVYHIDRGYERIEEKLSGCGANISRSKVKTI